MRRLLVCAFLVSIAAPAFAQVGPQPSKLPPVPPPPPKTPKFGLVEQPPNLQQRLPVFVADLRGVFIPLKVDLKTADTLGIPSYVLPGRGLGLVAGVHVYPLRRGSFGLGLGGEFLMASGSDQDSDPVTDLPVGPAVHRELRSLSGQLTLNFGRRQGWSYASAGFGPFSYHTYLDEAIPDGLSQMATNFGFGGRWFNNEHVAFNVDLRFYLSPPSEQVVTSGGRDRQTLMVISVGISLK